MAEYFFGILNEIEDVTLTLSPVNFSDSYLYFKVASTYSLMLPPEAMLRYVVIPADNSFSDADIQTMLEDTTLQDDDTQGIYFGKQENTTSVFLNFTHGYIKVSNVIFENSEFNVYWITKSGTNVKFNKNITSVYSLPHNINVNEVSILGTLNADGSYINYKIKFNNITNDDGLHYTVAPPNDGPYWMKVVYKGQENYSTFTASDIIPSGTAGNSTFFGTGQAELGIDVNLPFFNSGSTIPAYYVILLNNNSVTGLPKLQSTQLKIDIDHSVTANNNVGSYFKDLDAAAASTIDKNNIKRLDKEIYIEPGIIDRSRLSIRLEDVGIKENTYTKYGSYISSYNNLDYSLYTFSLKVDEYVPKYDNLSLTDAVSYYVEFNNREWLRISPITRGEEYVNGAVIPKLFIFDKSDALNSLGSIKFLEYPSSTNSFRIKIELDLRRLEGSQIIPPEIRGYKCVMFDKSQFLNF